MEKSIQRLLVLLAAAFVAAFALSACGSSKKSSDSCGGGSASTTGGGSTGAIKEGGTANIALTSQPDFLDPALSYTVDGWQTLWLVYTPLITYPHKEGAEGATLQAGLAQDMPEISADGKTYKLKLRQGLKFSDGTPVKASDFEHTIKRVLFLESGGSAFFLPIVGAEDYAKKKKENGDISGITTDDKTGDITIKLTEKNGAFSYVLAMDFAGLVPGNTPFRNMTKDPPPGVGPYKITSSVPNRQHVIEKVPGFNVPGIPTGHLDKINIAIIKNQQKQTQDIIDNQLDSAIDPPPTDMLRQAKEQKDRYKEEVTNSTYYFFMNTRVPPFDKKESRQAVNFAIDKKALARLFGGLFEPDCNFLPPGMLGYKKINPCPYGDPNAAPNVEKAKELVKAAGVEGMSVNVYANDEEPSRPVGEYLADVLNKIGFKAKPKIVEASVYFQTIGNQKTKAQTGFANWFQDFPHPANFMFLVNGKSIQETNNQNYGNVDDPEVTAAIEKLNKEPNLEEVADQWAAVDKRLIDEALVAPYGHRKLVYFQSNRMNFAKCTLWHPVYQQDYSSYCLK